jgi:hypothetical protein
MPMMPVMSPPVRKLIQRGSAFAKSFAGETTLAAMFTASVATTTENIANPTTTGFWKRPTSFTGSQIGSP